MDAKNILNFGHNMYGELDKSKNIIFSPFSISAAMAMPYVGAKGRTAEGIAKAMCYPQDALLDSIVEDILAMGIFEGQGFKVSSANAAWLHKGYKILESFRKRVGDRFREVDFKNLEAAAQTINAWVSEHTNGMIKKLVKFEGGDIKLVLTNAVHFKGIWTHAFDKEGTRKCKFHGLESDTEVDMMRYNELEAKFINTDHGQALELEYGDGKTSMVIVLPTDFRSYLASKGWNDLNIFHRLDAAKKLKGLVLLPKFKMEWSQSLREPLVSLGAESAFGREADFSGISGNNELFIGDVVHKAAIDVNEEGTEAAAGTAVMMLRKCSFGGPRFIADRPFLFYIRSKSGRVHNNLPLFMGQLVSP